MGIEDIQISEKLETNAPSIKYSGNEGPKSPQEMEQMVMAQLEEEYAKYVFEMQEQGIEPMSMQQFIEQAMAEGQMSGGTPLPNDPTGPVLPDRQMAAYGGIMGLDGRRKYGFGSSLKKFVRKVIPNEVADIAVKAAPFVAMIPGQQGTAALMRGLGRFDQTGSMSDAFKQGALTYGFGKVASPLTSKIPGIGTDYSGLEGIMQFGRDAGSSLQGGYNALKTKLAPANMSNPANIAGANQYGVSTTGDASIAESLAKKVIPQAADVASKTETGGILNTIKKFALDNKLLTGLAVGSLGATALMGNMEPEEIQDLQRGEGLDVEGIRAEVIEAFKDPSGEKLAALRSKYPFLGTRESKNIDAMGKAMGGRIGKAEGGIMDLGGMEKDYRAEGGFVPIGKAEKADDVPARLSVNEFVFTADAVRNAGGGDIDKGAEVMENMMKHLEQGGQVSEESQGMAGARDMFATSQRLSEVI